MNSAAKENFLFLTDITFLERGLLYTVILYRKGGGGGGGALLRRPDQLGDAINLWNARSTSFLYQKLVSRPSAPTVFM